MNRNDLCSFEGKEGTTMLVQYGRTKGRVGFQEYYGTIIRVGDTTLLFETYQGNRELINIHGGDEEIIGVWNLK